MNSASLKRSFGICLAVEQCPRDGGSLDLANAPGTTGISAMKSKVDQQAVPFELPDAEGTVHRLEQYAGNWLLLVFHRHLG